MRNPILSIIIPAYNAENTIRRCLESILNQSFEDYEIIVIDDGSTDTTKAVCQQLSQSDQRIRFYTEDNQGVSTARNYGIQHANGKYLMFVDGDDEILPGHLEAYVKAIDNIGSDIVMGGITKIFTDESGKQISILPDIESGECDMNCFWNNACFNSELFGYLVNKIFRADIIQSKKILLRTDMYSQEDLDFCLSYYQYCEKVSIISDAGYLYYYQGGKRKPQVYHYIENQLKLIHTANEQAELVSAAEETVRDKIVLWVFSVCYYACNKKELYDCLSSLNQISGLYSFLKRIKAEDEKTMVAKWYCHRSYNNIYWYFKVRNRIKRVVSALKRR